MKGFRFLLVIIIALVMIVPMSVIAKDEESKEAIVYFFRGEGCSHCAEFESWLEEIEEEYGKYFEVKDYETWYDEDNQALMKQVAEARGEEADGVPYIIVGNKTWNGFADEYKDEILDEIMSLYDTDVSERYDIMKYLESGDTTKKSNNTAASVVTIILSILVVSLITLGIIKARKDVK